LKLSFGEPAANDCCTWVHWETTGIFIPMETTVDSVGRIVVPKQLRDSLGMQPGTTVEISAYGAGLQVLPAGRTARIVEVDGHIVAASDTPVTDDIIFGLIDSLRR
jgi:AbrB family looped-hinge helix DNA binding protein